MLGTILGGLTNEAMAEEVLSAIGDKTVLAQVHQGAAASGVSTGAFVAATVRHLLDHGDEEVWLDLLRKMAGSPQPGAAALQAILERAFLRPEAVGTGVP